MARKPEQTTSTTKRTVTLRDDQIVSISTNARENDREFSAELRTMIDRDLSKVRSK